MDIQENEPVMKSPQRIVFLLPLLPCLYLFSSCSSIQTAEFPPPQNTKFSIEVGQLHYGMSKAAFFKEMRQQQPIETKRAFGKNGTEEITYRHASYVFDLFKQPGGQLSSEVGLINRKSNCSYYQDNNGAFEAFFPLTKKRAKELFFNSASPLGFQLNNFTDKFSTMSYTRNRKIDLPLEAILQVQFTEVQGGTRVYVNTESTELVMKSRDKSYAQSILWHMYCSNYNLSQNELGGK